MALQWTPIQTKMLEVLNDGKPHTKEELHACLNDDLAPINNIYPHVSAINAKLRPYEQLILWEGNRYRRVRILVYSE